MPVRRLTSTVLTSLLAVALAGCDLLTPENPSITLTVGTAAVTLTQGQNNTVSVEIGRTDFEGDVMLAVTGLPTGVTASFNPATVTGSGTTSTLTLTATTTATPGDATLTVEASGEGVDSKTATIALTVAVAGNYTMAASPASITLNQGASATSTITITRSGGFAQNVTLAASGLPSGVTAAFNPSSVSGTSSTLTLTAANNAATGAATVTITGTTPGLTNVTTNISLTVQVPPTTTNLSIDFCSNEGLLWAAFQNEGAAWTRVIPDANGTITFAATAKVGIAFAFQEDVNEFATGVYYTTVTELMPISGVTCNEESGTRTLNGSASGFATNQGASISMGFAFAFADATQSTFSLMNLPSRALDLVGIRSTSQSSGPDIPDRVIIRRGITSASGTTMPNLDFGGSEAVAIGSASFTANGLISGEDNSIFNSFQSVTETFAFLSGMSLTGTSATGTFYGIPGSLTVTGDMHTLFLAGGPASGATFRGAATSFRTMANKTLTLGAVLNTPTYTQVATTPYVRFRGQLASQTDYNMLAGFNFSQPDREAFMGITAAYLGGTPTTWDITFPDFSGVAGWQNTWGLRTGATTETDADAQGGTIANIFSGMPTEGDNYKFATRSSQTSTAQLAGTTRDDVLRARAVQLLNRRLGGSRK